MPVQWVMISVGLISLIQSFIRCVDNVKLKEAVTIGVSQSAMSRTLSQIRNLYKDDLLVRGPQGRMQLTSFAASLVQPVKETMRQAEALFIAHASFLPASATRTFHLGMSNYIAFVLLTKLMQAITFFAPNVKIVQHAINH